MQKPHSNQQFEKRDELILAVFALVIPLTTILSMV